MLVAYIRGAISYLAITVPLTHLVNAVDRRLREGRPDGDEVGATPAGVSLLPVAQERA